VSWKRVTKIDGDLNDKQRIYVAAYLETLNGTAAAEIAGFSKKSAEDRSKDLQRNPKVRAAIEQGLEELEREWKDKALKVIQHAYCLATVDIADFYDEDGYPLPLHKIPRDARRAIASVEVEVGEQTVTLLENGKYIEKVERGPRLAKFRLHDKRAAAELFLRYAGKLKDRVELEAPKLEELVMQADRLLRARNTEPDEP
jgi:phage terminase small subunit